MKSETDARHRQVATAASATLPFYSKAPQGQSRGGGASCSARRCKRSDPSVLRKKFSPKRHDVRMKRTSGDGESESAERQ
jgi:hypothetical protein